MYPPLENNPDIGKLARELHSARVGYYKLREIQWDHLTGHEQDYLCSVAHAILMDMPPLGSSVGKLMFGDARRGLLLEVMNRA